MCWIRSDGVLYWVEEREDFNFRYGVIGFGYYFVYFELERLVNVVDKGGGVVKF